MGFLSTFTIRVYHKKELCFRFPLNTGVINTARCGEVCQGFSTVQWLYPAIQFSPPIKLTTRIELDHCSLWPYPYIVLCLGIPVLLHRHKSAFMIYGQYISVCFEPWLECDFLTTKYNWKDSSISEEVREVVKRLLLIYLIDIHGNKQQTWYWLDCRDEFWVTHVKRSTPNMSTI
jgi:hypothetical protein